MKFKARLEPSMNAPVKWIWEIRALQFGNNGGLWKGRPYFYEYPPFYRMKAVTNTSTKIIHFAFNDETVPVHLKGSGDTFCHKAAIQIIEESKRISIWWSGKKMLLEFEKVQSEVRFDLDNGWVKPDIYGTLKIDSPFIQISGSRNLAIELLNSSRSDIVKKKKYRELDIAAIEIPIKHSPTCEFEKKLRQEGRGIPSKDIEQSYGYLRNFLMKRTHKFDILHFPSMKDKRFEESKIVYKAKTKAFNSNK